MAGFADFTYWEDGVPFLMAGASGTSKFVFWMDGIPFDMEEASPPDPFASQTFASFFPGSVPHRKTWAHWQHTGPVLPPDPPFVESHFPDRVPHRLQFRPVGGLVEPFTPAVIPVPDILHNLTFQARFPDQVPHHRLHTSNMQSLAAPPPFPNILWTPHGIFPDQVPHRRLSVALMPTLFEPPQGELIRVAQSMAWQSHFPDKVPHRRYPQEGGQPWFNSPSAQNGTFGVGECVTLQNFAVTRTDLINAQVTVPTLLNMAVTISTLVNMEVC